MPRLSLDAHAKINLTLEVLGKRADGYHGLRTIFQSLALHDTIEFADEAGPFRMACDDPAVPADARNLVWRAAVLVWQASGRAGEPEGARVRLRKRIPAQGGLGGGSADAAVAVIAFSRLWLPRAAPAAWGEIARQLGADVPFFLCGGTALGVARGDEVVPMANLPARHVVLVFPPFGVSTAEAYGWLDQDREAGTPPGTLPSGELPGPELVLADGTAVRVRNDLEGPVVARHPEIGSARDALKDAGADAAAMSGSGSTVFGLFSEGERAGRAAAALAADGWRTLVSRTIAREEASRFLV
ncbi:MAG TPA: 4-(cytidine 5'-diphospho)-2-C-methyl-D-erythritol kinase [Vicinamibacterales bacterium]|nr:4-(cytidine 5'-diphospho)-2-C-methyl-D-erythritol kinase [Vicinamibacterales bacterium]